jgi:hypothetical protein
MKDAFLSFASYSIGEEEFRADFKKASGIDIKGLIPKTRLEAMIDKTTGHTDDILRKFMDWLIVNHWGEEE